MRVYEKPGYQGFEPMLFNCTTEKVAPGARARISVGRASCIIECNEEGYGTFTLNGRTYEIKPHCCYVVPPSAEVVYTSDEHEPRRGIFCGIGGVRVGQMLSEAGIDEEHPFIAEELYPEVRETLYKMLSLVGSRNGGAEYRRTASVYELFGVIASGREVTDSATWIRRAVGIFETSYHTPVTIKDIADSVGFERTYFSTVFKAHTGVSPYEYLTSLRIDRACELIVSGMPIGEVASSVGLDPRNFSRVFKEIKGTTPLEYKKQRNIKP